MAKKPEDKARDEIDEKLMNSGGVFLMCRTSENARIKMGIGQRKSRPVIIKKGK
tara:strand:+ start:439 stop:600 length:162 start_codon:yes stop_codon:yes gene_type:complete